MRSKEAVGVKIDLEEISRVYDEEPIENTDIQTRGDDNIEEHKISDSTLSELDKPANYKEAMASPEADKWKEAMKSEIQSMYDNKVWNLVDTYTGLLCGDMDVKTAFLNGKLTYDVFMAQPESFENAKYPKRSAAVALDGTLCLVDQDRLRPIIVDDLSKWETVGCSVQVHN
ncbi:hypothetical protein Tco_0183270 [Tanacetum coccineum]